jgi:hypothetical protein
MKFPRICASVVALASSATLLMRAQTAEVSVQTTGPVHTAAFQTPQGIVRVHVSSDAAAGDTISGMIVAEPVGATPQAREANLRQLANSVVEWQSQRAPVSARRYEWQVPVGLRTGYGALMLRDRDGKLLSQASLPIDPVPAPATRGPSTVPAFELPTEGQKGAPAVILGRSDGSLTGKTVTLGETEVDLLAASPRQLAFRVPATALGPAPVRFASADGVTEGTLRVLGISMNATSTQLGGGQRATLTITVSGLNGITEPVTLTVLNRSAAIMQVENIDRPITITPRQVTGQGTFVVNRRITGVRLGTWEVVASVGKPPLAQFDVQRSIARILADWQAKTGVAITADASSQIQRSVLDTRMMLDDFLRRQQLNQGDVQAVFAALLSHYCFDLRDDSRSRRRVADGTADGPRIRLVALGQNRPAGAEITAAEVDRLSFSDFLSRLIGRFSEQQAVGYLFVSSTPAEAPITIDGQRKGEVTNRRFVTSVGDHMVVVAGPQTCRQRVTVNAFQTKVIGCGV